VMNFASDTRLSVGWYRPKRAGREYNSRQSGGHLTTVSDTVHSTIYRTKTVYTTQDIGQKGH